MAKKQFVFNTGAPQRDENAPQVDFDAMNQYIVDTVGCSEKPEAMIGIVSGVIDLGLQKQDDAKMEWKGSDEERAAIEAKAAKGETQEYFEVVPHGQNNVPTLCKRWPVKPQRCVALTFDIPDLMINRGKWFDEEGGEELPFRGLLNNEFGMKGVGKIVGKPFSTKEQKNDDGSWSLKNNTILFKLAQATNQLEGGKFKPSMLGNLIGEAAMFNVHVFINEQGGKKYLNEKMSFNGPVPKAMQKMIPELDEKFMYMINFTGEQDLEALKQLRQSVVNTMKLATDFEGSDIQKALIQIGKIKEGDTTPAANNSEPKAQAAKPQSQQQAPAPQADPVDFDDFDDQDIPF